MNFLVKIFFCLCYNIVTKPVQNGALCRIAAPFHRKILWPVIPCQQSLPLENKDPDSAFFISNQRTKEKSGPGFSFSLLRDISGEESGPALKSFHILQASSLFRLDSWIAASKRMILWGITACTRFRSFASFMKPFPEPFQYDR